MPSGIVFALGALVCAALNDIVFKKAAASGLSVGWFASMIGTTWGVVQVQLARLPRPLYPPSAAAAANPRVQVVGLFLFKDELLTDWNDVTLKYAPWVAVILAAANLAIIEALAGIPASAGSTVYRLNSVGVVLGGWLLLGEPLSSLKLGGVSSGEAVTASSPASRLVPPAPARPTTNTSSAHSSSASSAPRTSPRRRPSRAVRRRRGRAAHVRGGAGGRVAGHDEQGGVPADGRRRGGCDCAHPARTAHHPPPLDRLKARGHRPPPRSAARAAWRLAAASASSPPPTPPPPAPRR